MTDADPAYPDTPGPLEWSDSHGCGWRIHAQPAGITVESDSRGFVIPSQEFDRDVYISPMGDQAVVRLSGPDDEVGFLVTSSAAQELVNRLQARLPTAQQRIDHDRAASAARAPTWPKMTAVSVVALSCAALSFIPFAGFGLAAIAIALLLYERFRSKPNAAWLHVRWMSRISAGLVVWGLGVCALATWSWTQPLDEAALDVSLFVPGAHDNQVLKYAVSFVVLILSLSVHESAHAITAWWCGDDYAKSLGRVTLDPRAHVDLFGTVVLPALLISTGMSAFGYAKPVPVQVGRLRRFRRDHILVSIAGPGSNLLLAAAALSMLTLAACLLRQYAPEQALMAFLRPWQQVHLGGFAGAQVLAVVLYALKLGLLLNIILAAFNLIPVPPLDGSWVLEHLFPNSLGRLYAQVRPFGFLLFMALFFTGALRPLMRPAWWIVDQVYWLLGGCLGLA